MKDFWVSCGHHLLDRDEAGALVVTEEFLKAYLARPELSPPPEACAGERALHAALLAAPRRPISDREIAAIADRDARENWALMREFRDRLMARRTVEAAYLDLIRSGAGTTPPLFINQLVHAILRNVLDGCEDPFVLRAAELFFRTQRMTVHGGSLIAADEETVAGTSPQPLSPLVAMLGVPVPGEADVLNEDNAPSYWERSDRFDMALDLTAGRRGLPRSAKSSNAGLRILARGARKSSPSARPAMSSSPGISASTRRRPRSGTRSGRERSLGNPRVTALSGFIVSFST